MLDPWLVVEQISPTSFCLRRAGKKIFPEEAERLPNKIVTRPSPRWHFVEPPVYLGRSHVTNSCIEDNRIYDSIIRARLLFAQVTRTHGTLNEPKWSLQDARSAAG